MSVIYFRKINILAALVTLGAVLVSTCPSKAQTVEDRRQTSLRQIESAQSRLTPDNTNGAQFIGAMLEALNAATPQSLSKPVIANAQLQELLHIPAGMPADKFPACRLDVHWLEDQPTPDAVEVKFRTNASTVLEITPLHLNDNRKVRAKQLVVFVADNTWTSISNFEAAIGPVTSSNHLQVRLLRAAQPVTDWSPVYFYTVDIGAGARRPSGQRD